MWFRWNSTDVINKNAVTLGDFVFRKSVLIQECWGRTRANLRLLLHFHLPFWQRAQQKAASLEKILREKVGVHGFEV